MACLQTNLVYNQGILVYIGYYLLHMKYMYHEINDRSEVRDIFLNIWSF